MAQQFNLTVQLQLKGPANLAGVASNIKKQLSGINANVNVTIAKGLGQKVTQLNQGFKQFNATLIQTAHVSQNATTALSNLSKALGQIGAASQSANTVNQNVAKVGKTLQAATSQAEGFGRAAGLAFKRFAAFSSITGGIFALTAAIGAGVKEAIEFDKEMIKLSQVTGKSVAGLQSLEKEITNLAKKFGVSSKELLNVASTLAQAGLSAKDTEIALESLAKSSLAPSFKNMAETTEGAIAIFAQFGLQAKDLEKVLGSINAVSAKFAVEAEDIISAIRITGGVFAATSKGVDEGTDALNKFVAVFTSIRATTRESAESIATGLRTIFTRVQRADTIDKLREFGVELTDLEGKFVGPYEATNRLSEALNKLDPRSTRFSSIVEELGGYRQIGKVIPLIQQAELKFKALAEAEKGAGSLAEDAGIAQLSLANRISKVTEEFLALLRAIAKTESFQAIVTLALDGASAFIKLADAIKPIIPFLAVLGSVKIAQSVAPFIKGFASGIKGKKDGGPIGFARGGMVPGTGNGDTVPAMLEPGEFVLRKKAVQALGAQKVGSLNKYANGGYVQKMAFGGLKFGSLEEELEYIKKNVADKSKGSEGAIRLKQIKQELASNQKEVKKTKANVHVSEELPLFGGIGFALGEDSPNNLRSSTLSRLSVERRAAIAKRISKPGEIPFSADSLGDFQTPLSLNLIDPHVQETFIDKLKDKMIVALEEMTHEYGGGLSEVPEQNIAGKLRDKLDFNSIGGHAFEGLISLLSGKTVEGKDEDGSAARWDFPINKTHLPAFKKLFGPISQNVGYLDAKATLNQGNITSSDSSIMVKAMKEIADNPGIDITADAPQYRDFKDSKGNKTSRVETGTGITDRLKKAMGGPVQKFAMGGLVTGAETVENNGQVRNLVDTIARAYKIPNTYVQGIHPLTKDKMQGFKEAIGVAADSKNTIRALWKGSEKAIYYTPGVTDSRGIIHELGHAVDQYLGEKSGKAQFGSHVEGSKARNFAGAFQATRKAQLASLTKKRQAKGQAPLSQEYIENRLTPHELFADAFVKKTFTTPDIVKRLAFANGGPSGTDTVPALLTPGEFVVNKNAVKAIGLPALHRMNKADKYAKGGPVRMSGGGETPVNIGGDSFNLRNFPEFDAVIKKSTKGTSDGARALQGLKEQLVKTGAPLKAIESGLNKFILVLKRGGSIAEAEASARKRVIDILPTVQKNQKANDRLNNFDKRFFGGGGLSGGIFQKGSGSSNPNAFGRQAGLNFATNFDKNGGIKGLLGRGVNKLGGQLSGGIGGLIAAPLIANAIGTETKGSAATGGALSGLLAGGAVGGQFGTKGALIGAAVGAISGGLSAFDSKIKELNEIKIKESIELADDAFTKFNKSGNLNELDATLSKVVASIVESQYQLEGSATTILSFGGLKGTNFTSLEKSFANKKGIAGIRSGNDPKVREEFLKSESRDILANLEPIQEKQKEVIRKRILKGESVDSILKNKSVVQTLGRTKENNLQLIDLQDKKENAQRLASIIREKEGQDSPLAQKNQDAADNAEFLFQKILNDSAKKIVSEEAKVIEITKKLKEAFGGLDTSLADFSNAIDKLENGLGSTSENARFRNENFAKSFDFAKTGRRDFVNPVRNTLGSTQINDKTLANARFKEISDNLGGELGGLKDIQESISTLGEFKKTFRISALKGLNVPDAALSPTEKVEGELKKNPASFLALPKVLQQEVKSSLERALTKRNDSADDDLQNTAGTEAIDQIIESLSKNAERLPAIAKELETQFNTLQQELGKGFNAYIDLQLEQNNKLRKIQSLELSQRNDLNKLLGKELSIDELSAPAEAGINRNPKAIFDEINKLRGQELGNQQFSPAKLEGANKDLTQSMLNNTVKIEELKASMETLATDTTRLSAIQEKLSQIQARKTAIRDDTLGIFGQTGEENRKQINAFSAAKSGKKLNTEQFNIVLQGLKSNPTFKNEEERDTAISNFGRRNIPGFDKLSKERQDAFLKRGQSDPEQKLIAEFKIQQSLQLQANKYLAEISKGGPQQIFNLAVDNFKQGVKELREVLNAKLLAPAKPEENQPVPPTAPKAPAQTNTAVPPAQENKKVVPATLQAPGAGTPEVPIFTPPKVESKGVGVQGYVASLEAKRKAAATPSRASLNNSVPQNPFASQPGPKPLFVPTDPAQASAAEHLRAPQRELTAKEKYINEERKFYGIQRPQAPLNEGQPAFLRGVAADKESLSDRIKRSQAEAAAQPSLPEGVRGDAGSRGAAGPSGSPSNVPAFLKNAVADDRSLSDKSKVDKYAGMSPKERSATRIQDTKAAKERFALEAKDKRDSVRNAAILKREEEKELLAKKIANDKKPLKDRDPGSFFTRKGASSRYEFSTSLPGAIHHATTDENGDLTEQGKRIDASVQAGRGIQGADARAVFAQQKRFQLASVVAGQNEHRFKQIGPDGQKAVAARVRGQGEAVQANSKRIADSVRAQGGIVDGKTFKERFKERSQADSSFGIPQVSARLPINEQFEADRLSKKRTYEDMQASKRAAYQGSRNYITPKAISVSPNIGGLSGAAAAASSAASAAAASNPRVAAQNAIGKVNPNVAGKVEGPKVNDFIQASENLKQSAEFLSKIPPKVEVGVTIAPVQVQISGAAVLAELEPKFAAMITKQISAVMNKTFNADGTQVEQ